MEMAQNPKEIVKINLGCGFNHLDGFINVDAFDCCNPDVLWDLNKTPWPWDDNSVDGIVAWHLLEHLDDWWSGFVECSRILRYGGLLDVRVPDESSSSAGTYRDHKHIITTRSFAGIVGTLDRHTNGWANAQPKVPMVCEMYGRNPFPAYRWLPKFVLRFCANHMRNFIHEQRFLFRKVPVEQS